MDKIEEVKKILRKPMYSQPECFGLNPSNWTINEFCVSDFTKQICQLFEPKPDPHGWNKAIQEMAGLKPDSSRLLTDEEKQVIVETWWKSIPRGDGKLPLDLKLEAQDAKTAEIKDAEFEQKCKDCEYDPQAAQFGWFIEQGWLTPEEAGMKDAECKELVRGQRSWLANVKGWRNPEQIKEIVDARIEALIEAYEHMLDGMGINSIDHFKVSDWKYVQELKATHFPHKQPKCYYCMKEVTKETGSFYQGVWRHSSCGMKPFDGKGVASRSDHM